MGTIKEARQAVFDAQNEVQDKLDDAFYDPDYLDALGQSLLKLEGAIREFKEHPEAAEKIGKWKAKDLRWAAKHGKKESSS